MTTNIGVGHDCGDVSPREAMLFEARDALIHFGGQWERTAEGYRVALERIVDVGHNAEAVAEAADAMWRIAKAALPETVE